MMINAAIAWAAVKLSPRRVIDSSSPKNGATEKIIWLRVAPKPCAAAIYNQMLSP